MKKNKKAITLKSPITIVVLLTLVYVVGYLTYHYFNDWLQFVDASKNIKSITLDSEFSRLNIKDDNYCMRNNMKFSKGTIGCTVSKNISYDKTIKPTQKLYDLNRSELKNKGWIERGENTESLKDYGYILARLYSYKKFDCFERYKDEGAELKVEIGCFKTATREWFFIKTD